MKKLLLCCASLLMTVVLLSSCSGGGDDGGPGAISNDYIRMKQGGRSIAFGKNETYKSIEIESNCSWNVSISTSNWSSLKVNPRSGSGNQNISLETDENETTSERTARLTLSSSGLSVTFEISQAAGSLSLKSTPGSYTFDANGGNYTFTIEGNTDWTVFSKPEWCDIEKTSGKSGKEDLLVKVGENPGTTNREGQIVLRGETTAYISVSQYGKSYSLTVSEKVFNCAATGETKQFILTCNGSWRLSIDNSSWCHASKNVGSSNTADGETITITCDPNNTTGSREAHVTIVAGNDAKTETVNILQMAGTLPVLTTPQYESLSNTQLELTASYESMFDVTEYGFCYGTAPSPTQKVKVGDNGGKTGSIETSLSLEDGKTYYVRAYAISAVGISYSADKEVQMQGQKPGKEDNPSPQD